MDTDDRPTSATDDTPLPPTLFAQRPPSLNQNWSDWLEVENQVFTNLLKTPQLGSDKAAGGKSAGAVNATGNTVEVQGLEPSLWSGSSINPSVLQGTFKDDIDIPFEDLTDAWSKMEPGVMLRGGGGATHFSTHTSPISAHILTCVPTQGS